MLFMLSHLAPDSRELALPPYFGTKMFVRMLGGWGGSNFMNCGTVSLSFMLPKE